MLAVGSFSVQDADSEGQVWICSYRRLSQSWAPARLLWYIEQGTWNAQKTWSHGQRWSPSSAFFHRWNITRRLLFFCITKLNHQRVYILTQRRTCSARCFGCCFIQMEYIKVDPGEIFLNHYLDHKDYPGAERKWSYCTGKLYACS